MMNTTVACAVLWQEIALDLHVCNTVYGTLYIGQSFAKQFFFARLYHES